MADYSTVEKPSEIELIVNRSRFIGRCFPVSDEAEALLELERVRKRHYDATHNCYAYAVGERGETARFSDDGEPGGTAGLPIMEVLKRRGLTFALIVVTRYFGGILLGANGLVRAYSRSASEAAEAAGVVIVRECSLYSLTVPYPLWGRVEGWLRETGALFGTAVFAEAVTAKAAVFPEREKEFLTNCAELTDGKIAPLFLGKVRRSSPAG